MSFPTLDETEYPLGSQKRQEKEKEILDNQPAAVPESEWAKNSEENSQNGGEA